MLPMKAQKNCNGDKVPQKEANNQVAEILWEKKWDTINSDICNLQTKTLFVIKVKRFGDIIHNNEAKHFDKSEEKFRKFKETMGIGTPNQAEGVLWQRQRETPEGLMDGQTWQVPLPKWREGENSKGEWLYRYQVVDQPAQ